MKKTFLIAAVLVLAFFAVWFFGKKLSQTNQPTPSGASPVAQKQEKPQQQDNLPESLNGERVEATAAQKRPIAIMVENHPDARPQSGLADADMVYETLTEGGITRFMAVYQANDAKNIGPVRSARTYFAEIADELGAIYSHVGGNSDALANIKANVYKNISDADQFFDDGTYFQRISSRVAPHNVYTSVAKMTNLVAAKHFNSTASYKPWRFKDDSMLYASSSSAQDITIDFSLSQFLVNYRYDAASGKYLRFMAGKPHTDKDSGKQIAVKDVVVQFVDTFPVKSDTPLSIGMTLTGQGKAYVFEDGKVIEGIWKKGSDGRTRYYDGNNQEIQFNRGQIWVEIVPNDRPVTWK